jgi:mono/diheme cytochrome c family protein
MVKYALLLSAFLLCGLEGSWLAPQQADAPLTPIPAEAAAMVNPVKVTPEALASAKKLYTRDCLFCHGPNGDGKGEIGNQFKLIDWTKPDSLKDMTDGQLFYIIQNGRGKMPTDGGRSKPTDIWNLVLYVRSFEKKPA